MKVCTLGFVIIQIVIALSGCCCGLASGLESIAGVIFSATPTPSDPVEMVLQQSAARACPSSGPGEPHVPEVAVYDGAYRFVCIAATGHETSVRVTQFTNQLGARAAFDSTRAGNSIQDFHGFPLSAWQEQYPSFPDGREEYRVWLWQADRWLISVRAFDDTHFIFAPDPQTVSEVIYLVATEHALISTPDE